MKTKLLTLIMVSAVAIPAFSQYDDDIYYNPKKDKQTSTKASKSNYVDMANMDVDAYNRRGQYYPSPIDTIGAATAEGDDFVYTQQIQKYYNPTIVVDNSDVLADVLNNSYGNVDIVINDAGLPLFVPASYYTWNLGWNYGWNFGPFSWGVGFYDPWWSWGPSYSWSWGWGPSYAWGPGWGWGPSYAWGPGWGWGPSYAWGPGWGCGWGPGHGHGPGWGPSYHANYRPHGNATVGTNSSWANSTRPGGTSHRGTASASGSRPVVSSGGSFTGTGGNHRGTSAVSGGSSTTTTHRGSSSTVNSGTRGTSTTVGGNHRTSGTSRGTVSTGSGNSRGSSSSGNSRGSSSSSGSSYRGSSSHGSSSSGSSRSSGSSYGGSSRSSGGSFGGGSRSGGGGGGSRGGGGHR